MNSPKTWPPGRKKTIGCQCPQGNDNISPLSLPHPPKNMKSRDLPGNCNFGKHTAIFLEGPPARRPHPKVCGYFFSLATLTSCDHPSQQSQCFLNRRINNHNAKPFRMARRILKMALVQGFLPIFIVKRFPRIFLPFFLFFWGGEGRVESASFACDICPRSVFVLFLLLLLLRGIWWWLGRKKMGRVPHAHSVSSLVTIHTGIMRKSPPHFNTLQGWNSPIKNIYSTMHTLETFFGPLIVAIIGAFGDLFGDFSSMHLICSPTTLSTLFFPFLVLVKVRWKEKKSLGGHCRDHHVCLMMMIRAPPPFFKKRTSLWEKCCCFLLSKRRQPNSASVSFWTCIL